MGPHPLVWGIAGLVLLLAMAQPLLDIQTRTPSIATLLPEDQSRQGFEQLQQAFGRGAPATLQVVAPREQAPAVQRAISQQSGIARQLPPQRSDSMALLEAVPKAPPTSSELERTIKQLRADLPGEALVGGYGAETVDLEGAVDKWTRVVIPFVLVLGFLLLLVAFRAPILAAITVLTNLLATGAAFGLGTLVFQDGFIDGLFGVDAQGYLDVWVPVFFFAMIFGLAMDYSVFLLAATREQWEKTGNPREALIEGMARSGRVIFSAAAVMVAVFFTFAIAAWAYPPIEMGAILGFAVIIEATIIRLMLVPVAMRLAGRWAWWIPQPLARRLPEIRWSH